MGEVEVELAVKGNPEGREDEHCGVPWGREGLARRICNHGEENTFLTSRKPVRR